jgi:hypothetical protein
MIWYIYSPNEMEFAVRKVVLMLLSFAIGSCATAPEWTQIDSNHSMATYADLSTIGWSGSRVEMWSLIDLKEARRDNTGKLFMSTKLHREYDCKEHQSRNLYFSFYSWHMAEGEIGYVGADPENWTPIPPDSVNEVLWKIACGKR